MKRNFSAPKQNLKITTKFPSLLTKRLLVFSACGAKQGESGYVLQIAIVLFLALVIGVAAFVSRSTSGLFGFAELGVNKEAREVAENAIQEMIGALNKEQNRRLLIAGNAKTWATSDSDLKNPCTQYSSLTSTPSGSSLAVDPDVISRFKVSATPQLSNDGNSNHKFIVQSVEYKKSDRSGFNNGVSLVGADFIGARDGVTRSLLRITVVGFSTKNGITSSARVAREFEVVPKCCKRSFGNSSGGENWGRDTGVCSITTSTTGSSYGIIGSLDGGEISGGGSFSIIDDQNRAVSSATCFYNDGSVSSSGDLTATTAETANCNTKPVLGSNDGVTFNPEPLQFTTPKYENPNCPNPLTSPIPSFCKNNPTDLTSSQHSYLYFNTDTQQVRLCPVGYNNGTKKITGVLSSLSCTTISNSPPPSAANRCYVNPPSSTGTDPKLDLRPYYEVTCSLRTFNLPNNSTFTVDTSAAKFNLIFDSWNGGTSYTPNSSSLSYVGAVGQTTYQRVQCRSGDVSPLSSGTTGTYESPGPACTKPVVWIADTPSTETSFQDKCRADFTVSGVTTPLTRCESFDNSELLNIYSLGSGSFSFSGESGGLGFNLIAPYASVTLKGGGSPDGVDFMGRIWSDDLTISGNPEIRTLSSLPVFCLKPGACNVTSSDPIFDYVARSYSQSQGF